VIVDWRSLSLRKLVSAYRALAQHIYEHILASNKENNCEGGFDDAIATMSA